MKQYFTEEYCHYTKLMQKSNFPPQTCPAARVWPAPVSAARQPALSAAGQSDAAGETRIFRPSDACAERRWVLWAAGHARISANFLRFLAAVFSRFYIRDIPG